MSQEIEPIDFEVIKRMRLEHRHFEAEALIKAHKESLLKEFAEGKRINRNIEFKVRYHKKKHSKEENRNI